MLNNEPSFASLLVRQSPAMHYGHGWIHLPGGKGALSGLSCTCMKTTTQSGQAWRGYERAPAMLRL